MELDTTNADRSWWLVKVPNYLHETLEQAKDGDDVGFVKMTRPRPQGPMEFILDVRSKNPNPEMEIPTEHRLVMQPAPKHMLSVFSEVLPSDEERRGTTVVQSKEVSLEGRVSLKGDAKPLAMNAYMKLKRSRATEAAKPTRETRVLDQAFTARPRVMMHLQKQQEKAMGPKLKKVRAPFQDVVDQLLVLFQKHEYYAFKDLQHLTQQPESYLKEVLHKIAMYQTKNPHKNMWHLRPDYRTYGQEDGAGPPSL